MTENQMESFYYNVSDMRYSTEYAEYIMEHGKGDRVICNGDTLLAAQEDGYLFEEFLKTLGE